MSIAIRLLLLIFGQLSEHFHLNMESNSWIKQNRHSMSIKRIQSDDPLSQSKDLVQDSIEKLKALFPQIVTEDKIDFNVLKEILGEEVEHGEEYYRFTWAGKTQARREAHKPSTGTLIPVKEQSLDWETTQNLYIEGDNLEVLKLLQKSYAEKVKMIYIDPPYNTGSDFVYKDNYGDNLRNYQEFTGQLDSEGNRLSTNSDSDGRYHSNWLNMMYPRLILAKNLLRDDGVIFISIDEHEVHNIRLLMENLFGRENLFAEMVVVRAEGGGLAKKVIKGHDYLLVFVKSQSKFKGMYRPKDIRGQVVEIDRRKFWIEEDWLREEFGKYGTLHYEDIEEVKGIDKKNEIDTAIEEGLYVLMKKGKKHIVGRYRALDEDGSKFYSIIKHLNKTGKNDLKKTNMEDYFDYPKPVSLLKELILGTTFFTGNENDIILDFFSGSSTTADSLMQLNLNDSGNRQFIMVQLPQKISKETDAYRDGFKTIADIGRERIRRVIQQIKESHPEKSEAMDLGFKVFRLDSSNINAWDGSPENLKANLFNAVNSIKSGRDEEDVLYEVLLKYGLDLTASIEQRLIERERVYKIYGGGGRMPLYLSRR